jgi:hypothetical protein
VLLLSRFARSSSSNWNIAAFNSLSLWQFNCSSRFVLFVFRLYVTLYKASEILDFISSIRREGQVPINRKLATKDLALIVCFTAVYAVFAAIPIFQILGMPNASITAAAITAPIIGILLGPYMGTLSVILGGTISFSFGFFSPMSFVSGIVASLCAGLLYNGRRAWCFVVYLLSLMMLSFYPSIGPAWLFPLYSWFQVAGLLLLVSPLESMAIKNLKSAKVSSCFLSFFVVSLTSTLAGQISGSFTALATIPSLASAWLLNFQVLTVQYPIERIVIAFGSALIGVPLFRILQSSNLLRVVSRESVKKSP